MRIPGRTTPTITSMRTTRRFVLPTLLLLGCVLPDANAAETPPPAAAPPAVAPPVTQWQPDVFPLGFWLGPPQAANTVESYRRIKDCGFTLAFVGIGTYTKDDYRETLDICQGIGLRESCCICMRTLRARMRGNRLAGHSGGTGGGIRPASRALAGWGLLDEPRREHFPELAAWNRTLEERTPGKLRFTNVLPLGLPAEQTARRLTLPSS